MAIRSKRACEAQSPTTGNDRGRRRNGSANFRCLRTIKRLLIVGGLGIAVSGLTGCTLGGNSCARLFETECIDEFMLGYRNRAMAERAWHCRKHTFCDTRYAKEFKDGFIQGYLDVASGGSGCTPVIAPSNYWGWRYQSAGGHQAINAWFQGFPQGAKAAEEDGVGHWQSMRLHQPAHQHHASGAPGAVPHGAATGEAIGTPPNIEDPFYPESTVPDEFVPAPTPETPGQFDIEPIEAPEGAAEPESVFDALFPPVAVGDVDGSAAAEAIVADRSDDGTGVDDDTDPLPFRFE